MQWPGTVYDIGTALGWTLLHFLWQGLIIALACAAARHLLASPRGRHGVALTGLTACLVVPAWTFRQLWLARPGAVTAGAAPAGGASSWSDAGIIAGADPAEPGLWLALLAGLWLLGVCAIAVRLFADWRTLRRVIRDSLPAPQALTGILERELARIGLRRPVRVRLTASYQVPGVYGLLRPVILMPVALLLKLPADQIETLIIHELAHVRRLDAIGNAIAIVARTLLYFHPLVHWLCRDLERQREILCDELVMASPAKPINYARAISAVASHQHPAPAALLTASGGELTSRVHHILALASPEPARPRRSSHGPLLLALALIALSLPLLQRLPADSPAVTLRPALQVATQVLAPALLINRPELPGPAAPALADLPPLSTRPPASATADRSALPAGTEPLPDEAAATAAANPAATLARTPAAADPPAPAAHDVAPGPAGTAPANAGAGTPAASTAMASSANIEAVMAADAIPATDTEAQPATSRGPTLLHMVHPSYPRAARRAGTEGSVELAYRVDGQGRAVDVQVVTATPAGRFESAAISALSRWQFASDSHGGHYRQIFDFNLAENAERCPVSTGSRICRD